MKIEDLDIEFRENIILNNLIEKIDYLKNNEFDDLFDRKYLIDIKILIELFDMKDNENIKIKCLEINKLINEKFFN